MIQTLFGEEVMKKGGHVLHDTIQIYAKGDGNGIDLDREAECCSSTKRLFVDRTENVGGATYAKVQETFDVWLSNWRRI